MTENNLPQSPDFAYLQVADAIAAGIEAGEIAQRLPSERDMATQYGVAYQTVRRSLQLLRERGLIITRPGRGTFAAPRATTTPMGTATHRIWLSMN
jgi:GntR family transcriptional regulator